MAEMKILLLILGPQLVSIPAPGGDPAREVLDRIASTEDVRWLEAIAGSPAEAAKAQTARWIIVGTDIKDVRTEAYARLGELATEESLAAIDRVEEKAAAGEKASSTIPLGTWFDPIYHMADDKPKILSQTEFADGKTYAVISLHVFGRSDFFLISSLKPDDPGRWSRPALIPEDLPASRIHRSIGKATLERKAGKVLQLSFDETIAVGPFDSKGARKTRTERRTIRIELAKVLGDGDKDGLTDAEEIRLGLDPRNKDTDGDGIEDGRDPCPNFAPKKEDDVDEDVQALKRALFAVFSLSGSRYEIEVAEESKKVQVPGYAGRIVYGGKPWKSIKDKVDRHVFVEWTVKRDGDQATVMISDYEADMASGSQEVRLRKIKGRWVVVQRIWHGYS
jgi:hypothetical protein